MIYNFTIAQAGKAQEFGLVTADSIEEAEEFVFENFDRDDNQYFNIEPGAEDLINVQYDGFAILTSCSIF